MQRQSAQVLVDVAINMCPETVSKPGSDGYQSMAMLIQKLIQNHITYDDALQQCVTIAGTSQPIEKIHEILTVPADPIPFDESQSPTDESNPRKKSRSWSPYEDTRLIAGIYKYGIDNWTSISLFVGNGRTRSQCSQRWQRGLDPHLSKDQWTVAEERFLLELVRCYGDKAWTQIAAKMGNRSDVQCRYRFKQMQKDSALQVKGMAPGGGQVWSGLRKTQSSVMTGHPMFPMPGFGYGVQYNPMLNHPNPFRMAMMSQNGGLRPSLSVPTIQFQPIPGLNGMVVKELPQRPMEAGGMVNGMAQQQTMMPPPAPSTPDPVVQETRQPSGRPSMPDFNFDGELFDDLFSDAQSQQQTALDAVSGGGSGVGTGEKTEESGFGMFDQDMFSVF